MNTYSDSGDIDLQIVLAILFIAISIAYISIRSKHKKVIAEKNQLDSLVKKLQDQNQDLEIENTKFRLNPHLFKNSLSAIQGFAYQTHYGIEKLAGVLEYILYETNEKLIKLSREVAFAKDFIAINRIKLNPDFNISHNIDAIENDSFFRTKLISPLITIHLIENAFKHADTGSRDAFIGINFSNQDGVLVLKVENKTKMDASNSKSKGGIGKATIQKRLDLLYKGKYELNYETKNGIHSAILKIKLDGIAS